RRSATRLRSSSSSSRPRRSATSSGVAYAIVITADPVVGQVLDALGPPRRVEHPAAGQRGERPTRPLPAIVRGPQARPIDGTGLRADPAGMTVARHQLPGAAAVILTTA